MKTNCINCGAPLHYQNNIAKCSYCRSEYTLDNHGYVDDYKVKLKIQGKTRLFYIANISTEYICDSYRDITGNAHLKSSKPKLKMELIEF